MKWVMISIFMVALLVGIVAAANLPPPASALPPPPSFGSSSDTTSSGTTSSGTTSSGTTSSGTTSSGTTSSGTTSSGTTSSGTTSSGTTSSGTTSSGTTSSGTTSSGTTSSGTTATSQKAGILNTLYGKSSGSSTNSADDLDALPDSFLDTSSNTNTRTTGTSSRTSKLTEEDIRRIVREEIGKTEQFSSGSNGVLWVAMAFLLIGGGMMGYIIWNRKKSSLSTSSSLPKIKIPQKVAVPIELTQYINANAHFGKVSLRKSLIASGWNPDQVRQALINSGL